MKNRISNSIIIILLITAAFVFREQIDSLIRYSSIYAPCEQPISYSLNSFDDKFGVTRQDFLNAIGEAEAIWEKPIGKNLFAYTDNGKLKINFIYDYRQQATNKLRDLGIVVKENKASYNELKAKYETLRAEYEQLKISYETRLTAFAQKQELYDSEVQAWNGKKGGSKAEYDRLSQEGIALQTELAEIKKIETKLNEYIDEINSLSVVLNRLVASLNLSVGKYNEIGASRGEEFTEGDYQDINGQQIINIYEFSGRDKLVRVLAHELGHALGIDHVDDPRAIMYKLNISTDEALTNGDLAELKTLCAIK
jgi:hypothetical protein